MDSQFVAMRRTVTLICDYGHKLPNNIQTLFDGAPTRWNNLKSKVSLAKQRLGPRIQQEANNITQVCLQRILALHKISGEGGWGIECLQFVQFYCNFMEPQLRTINVV